MCTWIDFCSSFGFVGREARSARLCACSMCDVEKPDEKSNATRDMNKAIDAIDPVHSCGRLQKEFLDISLNEDIEAFFELDKCESMVACGDDGIFDYKYSTCSPTELVDLLNFISM